jgi:dynein light chain LC8-type
MAKRAQQADTSAPAGVEFLHTDMPVDMRNFVAREGVAAIEEEGIEKDIATRLKRACETEYKGTWHCIVGRSFGCSVTNETNHLLFFRKGKMTVLAFQTRDEDPKFDE